MQQMFLSEYDIAAKQSWHHNGMTHRLDAAHIFGPMHDVALQVQHACLASVWVVCHGCVKGPPCERRHKCGSELAAVEDLSVVLPPGLVLHELQNRFIAWHIGTRNLHKPR